MRILFLAHRAPFPPNSGAKIRSFNMIRHLAAEGHEITVASLARDEREYHDVEGLREYCSSLIIERIGRFQAARQMLASAPTATPASMGYFYSRALARQVRAATRATDFDCIIVHSSSVAQYVEHCGGTPRVMDFCDMDSQKWLIYADWKPFPLSTAYRIEGRKLLRAETKIARSFSVSTVATPAELETLRGLGGITAADWFANGVDSEYFARHEPYVAQGPLCFVGRMDYYPNQQAVLEFCDTCWPKLLERHPGLELTIVGAAPSAAVRELGKLQGVTVTGFVDDVRPWLEQASIAIAPLRIARGTQNKILESMAMELPVVCTAIAAGGVDVKANEHLLVADDATQTVDAICRLYEDHDLARRLGRAARQRVLERHAWPAAMEKMSGIVAQHAARSGS